MNRAPTRSGNGRRGAPSGPPCPEDPSDGPLLGWGNEPGKSFYCPNVRHNGRPTTHPAGQAPASRAFFGVDEVRWDG